MTLASCRRSSAKNRAKSSSSRSISVAQVTVQVTITNAWSGRALAGPGVQPVAEIHPATHVAATGTAASVTLGRAVSGRPSGSVTSLGATVTASVACRPSIVTSTYLSELW